MVTRLDLSWEYKSRLIAFKCYSFVCIYRSKRSFRDDNNLHVSISVLDEAIVWQARLFFKMYLMVRVHLAAECDITIIYKRCIKSMRA